MELLTIFTPTYNRAYSLHLCYESLLRQTCKDFIWLIIDDGSSDGTKELVDRWKKNKNGFKIKYVYKENGGMHTGHNKAYELMQTELNVCIDSDDYMTDNAVEKIKKIWIENKDKKYSGIVALDIKSNGDVIGTELPKKKSIKLYDFYNNGGKGDKKLIYRTEVMKQYPPYPVFEGEKFVSLGYKYLLADQDYELLVLNEAICVVEYMEDGSSLNMFRQYYNNPKGFAFIRKEHMKYNDNFFKNVKTCIHYVSSSLLCKNYRFIKESPKKILTILTIPMGFLLSKIIKIKCKEG